MKNKSEDYDKFAEKRISREEIYDGYILHVVKDTVTLPNGETAPRELIIHNGAVCIVPLTDDGCIIMERQYRYGVDDVIWEIPAGKIDKNETDPYLTAMRELEEETGYSAKNLEYLGVYYSSPAILSEKIHIFVATGLTPGKWHRDRDEFLDFIKVPFDDVVKMIISGKIPDGKTQAAVLRVYAEKLKNNEKS